jgi:ATP-dependent DNA ligase
MDRRAQPKGSKRSRTMVGTSVQAPPSSTKTQPYSKKIAHRGIWVEQELLAEVEYRAKSADDKVRHPFFKGTRDDL